ncbi:MAG: hypothetical protein R2845_13380 [Thermomicrobiales bacterium]
MEPENEEAPAHAIAETGDGRDESLAEVEPEAEAEADEDSKDDDLIASILESVDEPSPMISASYPGRKCRRRVRRHKAPAHSTGGPKTTTTIGSISSRSTSCPPRPENVHPCRRLKAPGSDA